MIISFGNKATEHLYHGINSKVDMLNGTQDLIDLRSPPGNQLEALKGDLKGFHSIRINDQWRVIFKWDAGQAKEVQITDYH
jgi:proteic killer suppression protein